MQIRRSIRLGIAASRSFSRRKIAVAETSYSLRGPAPTLRTFSTQAKEKTEEKEKHIEEDATAGATQNAETEQAANEAQSSRSFFSFFSRNQVEETEGPSFASDTTEGTKEGAKGQSKDTKQEPERPKKLPPFYNVRENVKDVLAIVFGVERKRDVEFEYDMGLRPYPWVTYVEAATEERLYRNVETGVITNEKPAGFDKRAKPEAYLDANLDQHALAVLRQEKGRFEKVKERVVANPVAATVMAAGSAIKEGPLGETASKVKTKVSHVREDLQETWETSQHPLIVNAASVVDSLTSETDQARAIRDIKRLDAGFDEYQFVNDMRDVFLPRLAKAFLQLDMGYLEPICGEGAMAQISALKAARETDGLQHDGVVLNVSRVDILEAKTIESSSGGTVPVVTVSGQVQYVHCLRDQEGEIKEGGESNIRAGMIIASLVRQYNPDTTDFEWHVLELVLHGEQMYL